MPGPTLIIHGGAGAREGAHVGFPQYQTSLSIIRDAAWRALRADGARAAVLAAVRLLEDDPIFNAGLGSRIQRDGAVRMSAALMDAEQGVFAGVVNIERVRHPIDVADALSGREHTVVSGSGATALARELGMDVFDPITEHRLEEHRQHLEGDTGTVGAVALDEAGRICAGTSTGGVGYELPGRVSDSATVAGTFASQAAGVSCTGIGEHIVNHGAAVRVVIRVEDGAGLDLAVLRTIAEADQHGFEYGLIAVDAAGRPVAGSTRDMVTLYASRTQGEDQDFLSGKG